jgi:hypothetical protein
LAAEGASTLANRIHVARNAKAHGEILPIAWLGAVPNLAEPDEVVKILPRLQAVADRFTASHGVRLGAVIFDTLAATFALADENDNSEAAKIIRHMRQIGDAIGAVMIPVHHYGKGQETGLRGASGWRANCDAVLSITCDRNQITGAVSNRQVSLAKSRVGEEGVIGPFTLQFVDLGTDDDGEAFGSCYVDFSAAACDHAKHGAAGAKLSRAARAYLDAFARVILDRGEKARPFADGPEVKAVDREIVRGEFYRCCPADGDTEAKRAASKRKAFSRGERDASDCHRIVARDMGEKTIVWAINDDRQD